MGSSKMMRSLATRSATGLRAANARAMGTEAPVRLHGLDGRYATSLWKVAAEAKTLPKVEADLNSFKTLLGEPSVAQLLNNPSIAKKDAVKEWMAKSGYVETTQNFFSVLAENGRLGETEGIISQFDKLQAAAKGELSAEITVADELTAAQKKSLEKSLKAFTTGGQKMTLTFTVDPEILGGLVVNVGDKHINMSIRSRIQQLQNVLNQPLYAHCSAHFPTGNCRGFRQT